MKLELNKCYYRIFAFLFSRFLPIYLAVLRELSADDGGEEEFDDNDIVNDMRITAKVTCVQIWQIFFFYKFSKQA